MRKVLVGVFSVLAVTMLGSMRLVASPTPAQDAALIAKGEKIYVAQKCSVCHAIAGKGNKTLPLDGVGKKLSVDDTKEWIVDPVAAAKKHSSTKKPPMPVKKLPAGDVDALVAYMQSLK